MNRLTDGELSRLEREVISKTRAARLLGGDTSALQMMQRAIAELKCRRFGGGRQVKGAIVIDMLSEKPESIE